MAANNLKFDFYTRQAIPGVISALDAFVVQHPGAITQLEGPNEVNNFPFTYKGQTGIPAAVAYQNAFFTAAKADPVLASLPVLNFAASPYTQATADAANFHPYPYNGVQPLSDVMAALAKAQQAAPGKPVYFTEAGYPSAPNLANGEGVDTTTQAKLTLNLIMDAAAHGVAATYLYDLVDDGTNRSLPTDNFGLFTTRGVAKPIATAIHNLTGLLSDTGPSARSFTPTPLNDFLSGLPANGNSLVLETSTGVYDVVIWAEPTIWDPATHRELSAPSTSVSLDLGQSFGTVAVFDPLLGPGAIQTASNATSVTVSISDHPIVVQASNLAQAISALPSASVAEASLAAAPLPLPSLSLARPPAIAVV